MPTGGPSGERRARGSFMESVGHALRGLRDAASHRNTRIQLVAGILAGGFAAVAPLSPVERALLLLCTFAVLGAEAANTALEAAVDLHGGAPNGGARFAKDAAAGGVLAIAIGSLAVLAVVVEGSWDRLLMARGALALPAGAVLGVAVAGALLLGPLTRRGALRSLVLISGMSAWALLLLLAASLPGALAVGLLLALCSAAGPGPASSQPPYAPSSR
jgi:diacylglycerol kinase (ATP)